MTTFVDISFNNLVYLDALAENAYFVDNEKKAVTLKNPGKYDIFYSQTVFQGNRFAQRIRNTSKLPNTYSHYAFGDNISGDASTIVSNSVIDVSENYIIQFQLYIESPETSLVTRQMPSDISSVPMTFKKVKIKQII